ncbi:MAG: DUF5119 domain-containing protein [Bacteroidales bacterium]|nr:DUF5119 domain-containing protein [Bacteroidales bacterium]
MRRAYLALAMMAVLLLAGSCRRRPLVEIDNNVLLNITIEKEIVNYEVKKDPEMMRAVFYDSRTGDFVSHAFLPPHGGYVNLMPGRTYDVLVYNFDTEATVIDGDDNIGSIMAFTNPVPENIKSRLKGRAGNGDDELIAFEPDHLFVGKVEDVYIPKRGDGMPAFEVDVYAETVVETWIVEIDRVRGAEYIGAVSTVISGLADHNMIGSRKKSYDEATVFFEVASLTEDGHFYAKFNTFGRNEAAGRTQILSLVLTDTGGKNWCFNIDVTEKFKDNPEQYILIKTDEIEIERPEHSSGGGLAPEVDEWDDVDTEIII